MRRLWVVACVCACAAVLCAGAAQGQWAECHVDSPCERGYYCALPAARCLPCVQCARYARRNGTAAACLRTVAECGSCVDGYVESTRGSREGQCVPRGSEDVGAGAEGGGGAGGEGAVPPYVWAGGAALILALAGCCVAAIFLCRRPSHIRRSIIKIFTSTEASDRRGAGDVERPPPYNDHAPPSSAPPATPLVTPLASPLAAPQPYPYHYYNNNNHDKDGEGEGGGGGGGVERAGGGGEGEGARDRARQRDHSQEARYYNVPNWVRPPSPQYAADLPPSYEVAQDEEAPGPTVSAHDEDTMESTWSAGPAADRGSSAGAGAGSGAAAESGAGELGALLAEARERVVVRPPAPHAPPALHAPPAPHDEPPTKLARTRTRQQERNGSAGAGAGAGAGEDSAGAGASGEGGAAPPGTIMFNILVQQLKDCNVIKT